MGLAVSSLYGWLFSTEYKVVMVGLDNAGKTTILYRLHLGDVITTTPTVGSNVEEVSHRNVTFQVWDLGGQDKLRRVWSTYYVGSHAVVLVVDSMDRQRCARAHATGSPTPRAMPPSQSRLSPGCTSCARSYSRSAHTTISRPPRFSSLPTSRTSPAR